MKATAQARGASQRGEVLVAIMNNARDFSVLQEKLWYRIPVEKTPRGWPPRWVAFYHTKVFGDMANSVRYYGGVREIQVVPRHVLFPHEPPNRKSDRLYHRVLLESLEALAEPICSARARRIIFVPTTWWKFTHAVTVNDLFDDSPLEDQLWQELKKHEIPAERQWRLITSEGEYQLDFALFCNRGNIAVETDGDTWHATPERIRQDNKRNNALESVGWHVLRFNGHEIREQMTEYCLPNIGKTVQEYGGFADEGLVPRQFFNVPDGIAQQLTLFEEQTDYELD